MCAMSEVVAGTRERGVTGLAIPVMGALAVAAAIAFIASLLVGPTGIGLPRGGAAAHMILWEIRLPRAILGALIGGALGLSGAVLQGYLRNPLAEPGLLGIAGGASLGAVLAIHSGAAAAFALALPAGGLIGAALAAIAVMGLAGERSGPLTLILAGVAISSLAGALTTLALNLSPNPFATVEMLFWLLGSLTDRSLQHVWLAAPLILLGGALLLTTGRALDALTLGEEAAQNLGVDLKALRARIVGGTALAVGAATAVSGTIGFVGLVVPHLLRPLVGHEPRRLLPASAFGGAALVLAADVALRLFAPLSEVRLGVVTALIGAPFFLWLVVKTRRELGP
jgi:iron complex transport system permease protein